MNIKIWFGRKIPGLWNFSRQVSNERKVALRDIVPTNHFAAGETVNFSKFSPSQVRDYLRQLIRTDRVSSPQKLEASSIETKLQASLSRINKLLTPWDIDLSQIIEKTMRHPLGTLIAIGAYPVFLTLSRQISHLRKHYGLEQRQMRKELSTLSSLLLDASKAAERIHLFLILEDIDPPLRSLLPRLLNLPFIDSGGNNCSGHPGKNGYLSFGYRLDSKKHKKAARIFQKLVKEIAIVDTKSKARTYFRVQESLEDGIGCFRTEKTSHKNNTEVEWFPYIEELKCLWEELSDVIALFEKIPKEENISVYQFYGQEKGGSGYSGGKIASQVTKDILHRLTSIDPELTRYVVRGCLEKAEIQ